MARRAQVADWYLVLKVIHVVAVFAWMAGLFYLPRLFVYHSGVGVGSDADRLFRVMERRLLKAIMLPAAIASWAFGVLVGLIGGYFAAGEVWLWLKLALVVALTAFHWFLGQCHAAFAAGRNRRSGKFFRAINEVPTVLLIGIVVLVVVKPFG